MGKSGELVIELFCLRNVVKINNLYVVWYLKWKFEFCNVYDGYCKVICCVENGCGLRWVSN